MPFFRKISLYWKCQIFGWGLYSISWMFFIPFYFNGFSANDLLTAFKGFILGVLSTHLMKMKIVKWRIIEKSLWSQFIFLLLITIPFGILLIFLTGINYLNNPGFGIFEILYKNPKLIHGFITGLPYTFTLLFIWNLIYFLYKYVKNLKSEIQKSADMKIELLELEAKALRAQMNPHFIFNCLNSIKSLIQQHDEEKSVYYLTTFSKLIRNLFNSADKKEISLYDEIETCKLYLQLEAMRFDTKFSYAVNVDETIDLKSLQVPALIIQPFIENAIWHGIVPRNSGGNVSLNVLRKDGVIQVVIDDDGIGRETSQQNKSVSGLAHQSKGVNLTQSRLELNNLLQQRQAKLEVIDKKDENDMATGTKVILCFNESE